MYHLIHVTCKTVQTGYEVAFKEEAVIKHALDDSNISTFSKHSSPQAGFIVTATC